MILSGELLARRLANSSVEQGLGEDVIVIWVLFERYIIHILSASSISLFQDWSCIFKKASEYVKRR